MHCAYALNAQRAYALNAHCVHAFNAQCAYVLNGKCANLVHTMILPKYIESTLSVVAKFCVYKICTLCMLCALNYIQYMCAMHSFATVHSLYRVHMHSMVRVRKIIYTAL